MPPFPSSLGAPLVGYLLVSALLAGAVASWLLLRALIPQLRRRLLDQPNARSAHRVPTPRGGGLAFVLVALLASGVSLGVGGWSALAALPLLCTPLALVGLLDDRHGLPVGLRYGVQLLTALVTLLVSPLPVSPLALVVVAPLLLLAATAVINFTNFMDGLDGLVAGCLAVALAAAALELAAAPALAPVALLPLWALVGGLLGFLLWNWSPARVFMGDVGSTFLGAVFAGVVLQATSWPEALGLLLLATPLLGDACLCVPRRLLAGQRVFQAHRLHLFQRLHQAGWPHARVALLYIGATAALAAALWIGGWPWVVALAALELLIGFRLDQRVAVSFDQASAGSISPAISRSEAS
ncbi:glycosyl transferase [Synechococcus sp. CBW1107]|uniref:glycosyl transferase n=1 Tax=Synechococcus sp. CBW1107 TaxID=2789857 RepID=UPI002AD315B1|nr:glycosyl transferase [Synechococcus sp. CBW1107]CAK6696817.1 Phospho-N-acetylmuramoyl-pentapeptide-transferase [Synechococcus sp. CBW1107]